ncbi:Uncharacterised protein [Serratia grimesii]|nr:Uncharacterised protein [Serratia grimesii]CAI2787256.1 Uncharacterised protein [Serratia grimesii]SUI36582.1 Uncharacterised protein [Serratia grimesii]
MIQLKNEYGFKNEKTATGFSNRLQCLNRFCEGDPKLLPIPHSSCRKRPKPLIFTKDLSDG